MDGNSLGREVTKQAIPQVCGIAVMADDKEEFWLMFFAGMAGAMAAQIGFDASARVADAMVKVVADANQQILKTAH